MSEQKIETGTPYRQHFRYRMYKIYDEVVWSDNIATINDCRICELNADLTEPLATLHQEMTAHGFVFHPASAGFTSFSFPGTNEESWNEIMFNLD